MLDPSSQGLWLHLRCPPTAACKQALPGRTLTLWGLSPYTPPPCLAPLNPQHLQGQCKWDPAWRRGLGTLAASRPAGLHQCLGDRFPCPRVYTFHPDLWGGQEGQERGK